MEAKATGDSPIASRLRSQRDVVVAYLMSLLRELDTTTQARIIDSLLCDLQLRGSKEGIEVAREAGVNIEYDPHAAWGILLTMRSLACAYSDIAREGHETFASELPVYAAQLVEALNEIACTKPELVRDIAGEMIDWPIMASRNYPKKSDFKELADRIGLGSQSPVKPQQRHTWKPDTPVNRYLLRMLTVECWGDRRTLTKDSIPYYLDEVLMPLFEKVASEVGGWENYKEFAEVARNAAKRGKAGVQRSEIRGRVKKFLKALAS